MTKGEQYNKPRYTVRCSLTKGEQYRVIVEFCQLCNWAYDVWVTHRTLYDDNTDADDMKGVRCADALSRLSSITQEYCLLQIVKLHSKDRRDISIPNVINLGGWDKEALRGLHGLEKKLDEALNLTGVRNKVLAHNDKQTILSGTVLGNFPKDKDIEYFDNLQEFVDIIYDKVSGGPYPFCNSAISDAIVLVDVVIGKRNPVYQK